MTAIIDFYDGAITSCDINSDCLVVSFMHVFVLHFDPSYRIQLQFRASKEVRLKLPSHTDLLAGSAASQFRVLDSRTRKTFYFNMVEALGAADEGELTIIRKGQTDSRLLQGALWREAQSYCAQIMPSIDTLPDDVFSETACLTVDDSTGEHLKYLQTLVDRIE